MKRDKKLRKELLFLAAFFIVSCSTPLVKNDLKQEKLKGKVNSYISYSYTLPDSADTSKRELETKHGRKYNYNGNETERNFYNDDHSLSSKYLCSYDEKGNKIEMRDYDANGNLTGGETYKYDEKGNMIERAKTLNGNLISKEIFKYDSKGDEIERNYTLNNGEVLWKRTFKYDNDGNIIEEVSYNSDGVPEYTFLRKYDNNGNVIMWSNNALGLTQLFKYDRYDKIGNWRRRISFNTNTPTTIVEREIEYYK